MVDELTGGPPIKVEDDFLPNEYKEPVVSRYMKFEEGENRVRVLPAKLGKPIVIMGWEYWKTVEGGKRKPVRIKLNENVPVGELEVNPKTGELEQPRFFWALTVWNYTIGAIQILEITQKTVRQGIESLSKNPKWGSPINYDLVITQTDINGKITYSVIPEPKDKIDPGILGKYDVIPVDLEALYLGEDPFKVIMKG